MKTERVLERNVCRLAKKEKMTIRKKKLHAKNVENQTLLELIQRIDSKNIKQFLGSEQQST